MEAMVGGETHARSATNSQAEELPFPVPQNARNQQLWMTTFNHSAATLEQRLAPPRASTRRVCVMRCDLEDRTSTPYSYSYSYHLSCVTYYSTYVCLSLFDLVS